ncbi:MAG: hypothetical protein K1X74_14160 [Pirellulales bacterium]|nr:hypothetical protein [Pirellulales bacterium]
MEFIAEAGEPNAGGIFNGAASKPGCNQPFDMRSHYGCRPQRHFAEPDRSTLAVRRFEHDPPVAGFVRADACHASLPQADRNSQMFRESPRLVEPQGLLAHHKARRRRPYT